VVLKLVGAPSTAGAFNPFLNGIKSGHCCFVALSAYGFTLVALQNWRDATMLQLTVNTPTPARFAAARNIVPLERVILEDNYLLVTSTATAWVNQYNVDVGAKGLLVRYQRVIKSAKASCAKVVFKYGTKKKIMEVQEKAADAEALYRCLFKNLKASWEKKVITGISSPACDDAELNALHEMVREMDTLVRRNMPLGMAMTISSELKQIETCISERKGQAKGFTFYL
jgi:hypothetical protein